MMTKKASSFFSLPVGGTHQHAFFQPVADGFIVQFQAGIGQGYADNERAGDDGERLGKGDLVVVEPCRVEVDDGIVGDVEGVGNVAQEFAGF